MEKVTEGIAILTLPLPRTEGLVKRASRLLLIARPAPPIPIILGLTGVKEARESAKAISSFALISAMKSFFIFSSAVSSANAKEQTKTRTRRILIIFFILLPPYYHYCP